jgi:hypothetical protein
LYLYSDLSLSNYTYPSGFDDSLYVERVNHLLRGEAFGSYDTLTYFPLTKLPAFSLLLAFLSLAGIPYFVAIHVYVLLLSVCMMRLFIRLGLREWVAVLGCTLFVLNPVFFSSDAFRIMREMTDVLVCASMVLLVVSCFCDLADGRLRLAKFAILGCFLAFWRLLREESYVLWGVLIALLVAFLLLAYAFPRPTPAALARAFRGNWRALVAGTLLLVLPGLYAEWRARQFVQRQYGLPILNEINEGEVPRLIAAMRGVGRDARENVVEMVPRDSLLAIRDKAPEAAALAGYLLNNCVSPDECSYRTGCLAVGLFRPPQPAKNVCMPNSHLAFMLYMTAHRATMAQTQERLRRARLSVESACAAGRLDCVDSRGKGFFPAFEWRYVPEYVDKLPHMFKYAALATYNIHDIQSNNPQFHFGQPSWADLVNLERVVGKLPGDAWAAAAQQAVRPGNCKDWVAGVFAEELADARSDILAARSWKNTFRFYFVSLMRCLCLAGFVSFPVILGWKIWRRRIDVVDLGPLMFVSFIVVKLLALGYANLFMGRIDDRMFFSPHVTALLAMIVFVGRIFGRTTRPQGGSGTGLRGRGLGLP